MKVADLQTPCLIVDAPAFRHNVATMAAALPGPRLRPHVKAFKSTALARELVTAGHHHFCAATAREVIGMAQAGMGDDLLLANELLDPRALAALADLETTALARVTIAVDSDATIDAAAAAGLREVLIDVDIGMPRCGCSADDAGRLADRARGLGLEVRGVMGYEGHIVGNPSRAARVADLEPALEKLGRAHDDVGGDIISSGGTGTYDLNGLATEIQAGSYVLMDTHYDHLALPFRQGLTLLSTVLSTSTGWAVGDAGIKAQSMDLGDPSMDHADVLFCSDEHVTFIPHEGHGVQAGERVLLRPAHVDPTIAKHEVLHVVEPSTGDGTGLTPIDALLDAEVVDTWAIDLRGW